MLIASTLTLVRDGRLSNYGPLWDYSNIGQWQVCPLTEKASGKPRV